MYIVRLTGGTHYVRRSLPRVTLCGLSVPVHTMAHAPYEGYALTCCVCQALAEDDLQDTHPLPPLNEGCPHEQK